MEQNTLTRLLLLLILPAILSTTSQSSLLDDLSREPPPGFNQTIARDCENDPTTRYCNASDTKLVAIYQSKVTARYLCNASMNENCDFAFTKISLQGSPNDTRLFLSLFSFWKYCRLSIRLITLSNNGLRGSFPIEILQCTQIESLDLSYNDLVGYLPLDNLSALTNLTHIDLSYNHFSGQIPGFLRRFNSSGFTFSGLTEVSPADRPVPVLSVITLLTLLAILVSSVGCLWWICPRQPDFPPTALQARVQYMFTPGMLKAATNNFSETNSVGNVGRYEVYKGMLKDGREVAVEVCRETVTSEARRAFVHECRILVQVRHRNLVQVVGWCDRKGVRAVVKAWVGNVTMEKWLSQRSHDGAPSWHQRLKVAVGVANAMGYIEEEWPRVAYDLRSSSLIVGPHREPFIFKLGVGEHISASKKVYKYGALVLELITNKRAREGFGRGEAEFVEWVRMPYPSQVRKVMDEGIKKTGTTCEQVGQVVGIALMCTDPSPDRRPGLAQMVGMITGIYESPPPVWAQHDPSSTNHGRASKGVSMQ
ncbi:hypothetical protein AMTRI_Chr09g17860 [Amborella trichopoda]